MFQIPGSPEPADDDNITNTNNSITKYMFQFQVTALWPPRRSGSSLELLSHTSGLSSCNTNQIQTYWILDS